MNGTCNSNNNNNNNNINNINSNSNLRGCHLNCYWPKKPEIPLVNLKILLAKLVEHFSMVPTRKETLACPPSRLRNAPLHLVCLPDCQTRQSDYVYQRDRLDLRLCQGVSMSLPSIRQSVSGCQDHPHYQTTRLAPPCPVDSLALSCVLYSPT